MAASVVSRAYGCSGNKKSEIIVVDMDGDASFTTYSSLPNVDYVILTPIDTATCTEAPAYSVSGNAITMYVAVADDPNLNVLVVGS